MWLTWAFLSFILNGVWGYLCKVLITNTNSKSAFLYQAIGGVIVVIAYIFSGKANIHGTKNDVLIGIIVGSIGMLATLFYYLALRNGPVGPVTTLTAVYPVVTIGLAYLFLGEKFNLTTGLGMAFAIVGVILISYG